MSESVWFEQVDTALIKFVKQHITVAGDTVDCRVRKPDEDFKKEDYPIVSLYNVYSKRDDFRRCPNDVKVSMDDERKVLIMEKPCLPYNLFYQIDFWAMMQSHMNEMLYRWVYATDGGRDFNLPVIDTGGNNRTCYCMCKEDFKKSDLVTGNTRIFHSFLTYRIYVEIDENVQTEEALITEIAVNTKQEV